MYIIHSEWYLVSQTFIDSLPFLVSLSSSDCTFFTSQINHLQDFPGGLEVKNPPANAGDMDSIPDPGSRIPDPTKLLSSSVTTPEARVPRAQAPPQEEPLQRETHTLATKRSPHLLQLEKACVQQQRPSITKNK